MNVCQGGLRFVIAAVVFLALSCVGIGEVRAQSEFPACNNASSQSGSCPDQGAAYSAVYSMLTAWKAANPPADPQLTRIICVTVTDNGASGRSVSGYVTNSARTPSCNGSYAYQRSRNWPLGQTCGTRPSQTTPFLPVTGSTSCQRGCVMTYAQNVDETSTASPTGAYCFDDDFKKECPTGSYWNGYMGVCEPIENTCPEGQELRNGQCHPKNQCPDGMVAVQGTTPGAIQQGSLYCKPSENECPAGTIKSTSGQCLPGEGQCAAGEARGKDGTCKKDGNGDGTADEEEGDPDPNKDSAWGGESCDTPPSCNGNPIQCMQLKVQWRIDCNTRNKVNVSGGTCQTVPVCTGKDCNAMEYAQLLQQWRTTCAVEKLAAREPGTGGGAVGDANGNGVADVLEGSGSVADPGAGQGDVDSASDFGIGVSTNLLSRENIFGSGHCPEPPSFKVMGQTISGADFPQWCTAMSILRALILLWGAYTAIRILLGWGF